MSTHIPPQNAEIDLWILFCHSTSGTFTEGIFTHKPQAEAAMRQFKEESQNNLTFSLVERRTQPHGEGQ